MDTRILNNNQRQGTRWTVFTVSQVESTNNFAGLWDNRPINRQVNYRADLLFSIMVLLLQLLQCLLMLRKYAKGCWVYTGMNMPLSIWVTSPQMKLTITHCASPAHKMELRRITVRSNLTILNWYRMRYLSYRCKGKCPVRRLPGQ